MSTQMLGNAESTDPRPRRKTTEPSKPNRAKQERRWSNEDAQERIEAKRLGVK